MRDLRECFGAFTTLANPKVFELGRLVCNNCLEWPIVFALLNQPGQLFIVGGIDIRFNFERSAPRFDVTNNRADS